MKRTKCCNYSEIMGRTRLANGGELLPDGGCRLYEPGVSYDRSHSKWNVWVPEPMPEEVAADLYMQMDYLYKQGLLDTEIARELGVGASSVGRWRKRNNLQSNYYKK